MTPALQPETSQQLDLVMCQLRNLGAETMMRRDSVCGNINSNTKIIFDLTILASVETCASLITAMMLWCWRTIMDIPELLLASLNHMYPASPTKLGASVTLLP